MNHKDRALRRVFRTTEGNSDTEKYTTWAALFVTSLITLGIMFGWVQIETGPQEYIWEAMKLAAAGLFGRVWGKEVGLQEAGPNGSG